MARYRPTPEQRRLLEGGPREMWIGARHGHRYATEMAVIATAATPEDARLLLEDLNRDGIALQTSDGKRVKPPHRNGARFTYVRFDEEKKK